jgi:hypothetical protein
MEEIILWECNIERIHAIETAVYQALQKIGYKARLTINCEMPLLSRHQMWERLPVLEIRRQRWSLCPGRAFTAKELTRLFARIFIDQNLTGSDPDADADDSQKDVTLKRENEGVPNDR